MAEDVGEVYVPAQWRDARPGPKHWTAESRSDDPTTRVVYTPTGTGPGEGRSFLFLFGYKTASEQDRSMLAEELAQIDDDVAVLREAGYTVVVDQQATRADLLEAVSGKGSGVEELAPAGFYWSSHGGDDGSLECCDGATVSPADIDPATVSPALRLAVLGACYVGAYAPAWRTALGGHPLVAGWGRPVTLERAVDFLEAGRESDIGLDDLIERWLLTDTPIPPSPALTGLSPAAVAGGRTEGLARRIRSIAARLGAEWTEQDNHYAVSVALPGARTHVVRIFVVDGAEPFTEGVRLCGMEAEVGPTSVLVTPETLLTGLAQPGYGRVALVTGGTGVPQIVTQSFTPLAGASNQQLAAHCHQVALRADALEFAIFGAD
ncbi:hypothetical protein ACFOOK_00565 [Micromonospora krabiensis]|uniref:Caspase domain-containing protein n=1 Tax=Micromonospora krabiensis TaxID=307121 RepID=A0A1C3MXR0_9ACTN|nr:hypothetical protein [Micromonospora krabiensis]SBV25126.1 hypothetical protein GA0070620_0596 [Micromonospora krabiensis]